MNKGGSMYTICLAEDEKNLANLIKMYLEKENYYVVTFSKGKDALTYLSSNQKVDLWILDIMLEDDISGYDIIKEIRKKDKAIPVIFTSARDQDVDKIIGLELGSDDYIAKPFSTKELVLRVGKIIERVYHPKEETNLKYYASYTIDLDRRIVTEEEQEIKLTTLEFDLLLSFIKNLGRTFSRDEILNLVWGKDYFGTDRAVDDLVRRLRKKMPKLNVTTIYGYGYRLT